VIIRDKWAPPAGVTKYVVTGKVPELGADAKEHAYWALAGRVEDAFMGEPATVNEIYTKVTRPLGLSSSDTVQLVRAAKREGYLRKA